MPSKSATKSLKLYNNNKSQKMLIMYITATLLNRWACFISWKSLMRVSYTFFCSILPTYCYQQDSGELEGHSWGGINTGVSFPHNSMAARHGMNISSFTCIRHYLKTFTWYCGNLSSKLCTKFHQKRPRFIKDYKNMLSLSFQTRCVKTVNTKINTCDVWVMSFNIWHVIVSTV